MPAPAPPSIRKVVPEIRHNAWGSHEFLAGLRGDASRSPKPEAELWVGAHPDAPCRLDDTPGTLADWIRESPRETLGSEQISRFGPGLPYLVKILAAAQPLSIQLHPNAEQARRGFAREDRDGPARTAPERSYRDPNRKHEMLIALTDFEGLCGLRSDDDLVRTIERSGCATLIERLRAAEDSAPAGERAAELFLSLARLSAGEREVLARELAALASRTDLPEAVWLRTLAALHPGDPSVAAPLILQPVTLRPGQALRVPPGVIHAYLCGAGVEVMTDSDNVVRGGLTAKHIDRPELARLLRRSAGPSAPSDPVREPDGALRYDSGVPEFTVRRIDVTTRAAQRENTGPTVVLCTKGAISLQAAGDAAVVELSATEAAFVPAACPRFAVSGDGVAFCVSPAPAQ